MPQHVRGENLGPVRQVHLGHGNGLEQATTSGLAVSPPAPGTPGTAAAVRESSQSSTTTTWTRAA
jgi:hypothetical protein